MTIQGLDPSGELGKLFFQIHSKEVHENFPSRTKASPGPATDAVDLSRLAQDIGEYAARAGKFPEVRDEKIHRIQQVLNRGEELASAQQLADALARETILNALST